MHPFRPATLLAVFVLSATALTAGTPVHRANTLDLLIPAQSYGGDDGDVGKGRIRLSRTLAADVKIEAQRLGIPEALAIELLTTTRAVDGTMTELVRRLMRAQQDDCGQIAGRYRISCLADGYRDIASAMPTTGDYAVVRNALNRVGRELDQIVRANRDRNTPRAALPARGSRPQSKAFTAFTGAQAVRTARDALRAAAQQLLRAVPARDPRAKHYERISRAFGDAAVLMRS